MENISNSNTVFPFFFLAWVYYLLIESGCHPIMAFMDGFVHLFLCLDAYWFYGCCCVSVAVAELKLPNCSNITKWICLLHTFYCNQEEWRFSLMISVGDVLLVWQVNFHSCSPGVYLGCRDSCMKFGINWTCGVGVADQNINMCAIGSPSVQFAQAALPEYWGAIGAPCAKYGCCNTVYELQTLLFWRKRKKKEKKLQQIQDEFHNLQCSIK